jgi:hypothetical protein
MKKKRGRHQKDESSKTRGLGEAISPGPSSKGSVTDMGKKECVDPEGNGVTMSEGAEGGPGPPSGEQDKQLICNSRGDKTSMGEPGGRQNELDATSRTHHGQSA